MKKQSNKKTLKHYTLQEGKELHDEVNLTSLYSHSLYQ